MPRTPVQNRADPRPNVAAPTIHAAVVEVGSAAGGEILRQWLTAEDERSTQRADRLLGRALLRGVLAQVAPLPAGRWDITKIGSGRPLVAAADGARPPSVSISHSGKWSACAVSFDGDVGIDIEAMRCDRDLAGIAARAFGPLERAEVAAEGCHRFYAIWTLREAVAKAVGIGLTMAADGKDRVAGATQDGFRQVSIDDEPWQIMQQAVGTDFSLALALKGAAAAGAPRLQWWFGEPISSA
jgi:phosphopantetheinyl transferase (holo-ACP synthase)